MALLGVNVAKAVAARTRPSKEDPPGTLLRLMCNSKTLVQMSAITVCVSVHDRSPLDPPRLFRGESP